MAADGIFIKILPQLELAALAAVIAQMKALFGKAGSEMSAQSSKQAAEIARLTDQQIADANRLARAKIALYKAAGDAGVAEERRVAVEASRASAITKQRADDAAVIAARRQNQAMDEKSQAEARAAKSSAELNAATGAVAASSLAAGRAFNYMGAGAAIMTGVIGATAVKDAKNYEFGLASLQAKTDQTAGSMKILHDGLLQVSTQTGASLEELLKASTLVAKAGPNFQDAANNLKLISAAAQLAAIEGTGLENSMQAILFTMKDFSFGTGEAVKVASMLRSGAKDASVSIDELAGSLHNVEPVMKILTQGDPKKGPMMFAQMMALVAQGTQGGTSADQTTDLVNNTVTNLITGSGNARAMYGAINGGSYEDLQKQLTTEGPIGIMQHMWDLVQSRVISDPNDENYGRVKISSTYNNLDQQKTLKRYYDTLSPEMQDIANRIDAGTLLPEDLRNATREGPENARLRAWYTQRNKVQAFNPVAQKYGSDYITPEQVILGLTNNQSGMKIMSQDFGTADARANLAQTQKDTLGAKGENGGADVSGWAKVAETLKVQIDQMKRSMTDAAISIGQSLLPVMKTFVEALTGLFNFFNSHQVILHALVDVVALMAGRWVILKTAMAFDGVFSSLGTGFLGLGGKMGGVAKEAGNAATKVGTLGTSVGRAASGIGSMLGPMAMLGVLAYDFLDMYGKAHPFNDNPDYNDDTRDAFNRGNDKTKADIVDQLHGRAMGGFAGKGGSGYPGGLPYFDPLFDKDGKIAPYQGDPDKLDNKIYGGGGHPNTNLISPTYRQNKLNGGFPVDDGGGYTPAGSGLTTDAPDGTYGNPVTVTIPGLESALSGMATGGTGGTGGGGIDGFTGALPEGVTNPLQAAFSGKGGFVGHIVQFFTGFLAELALGNPLGQLMARGQDGEGGDSGIDTSQIGDLSKMTASERKKLEYQLKLQEATRTAENAQRNYVDALSRFGPKDKRTANALNSWLNAKDNLDGILLSQQDAAQQAVEKWLEANAQLQKDLPGSAKYLKDKAIADKLAGQIPAGATATDADGNPIALPNGSTPTAGPATPAVPKWGPAAAAAARAAGIPEQQEAAAAAAAAGLPTSGNGNGPSPDMIERTRGLQGFNLATMSVQNQKYYNDCIDASAQIILSHAGLKISQDQLMTQIKPGTNIYELADGLNRLDPAGKFKAMPGSGGSQAAMTNAIQASIMNGTGSILNVAPGSSIGGRVFEPGHFIAATGYDPATGLINLSDTAGGKRYSVTQADAFQATRGRGIVAGTGTGWSPFLPTSGNGNGSGGLGPGYRQPGPPYPPSPATEAGAPVGDGGVTGAGSPAVSNNTAATRSPGTGAGIGAGITNSPLVQGAITAAGSALDAAMPGVGHLGTVGLKEANRFAQYLSQVAGIGVEALSETFSIHDPDGSSVGNKGGWISKIGGALAGAQKQSDNTAGNTAPPVKPDEEHKGDNKTSPGEMNINQTNNIHGVPDANGATRAINQGLTQFPMLFNP